MMKKESSYKNNRQQRNINIALKKFEQFSFPYNLKQKNLILNKLNNNAYKKDKEVIIDLKKDIGLYLSVAKYKFYNNNKNQSNPINDTLDIKTIKKVLDSLPDNYQIWKNCFKEQMRIFKSALLSSSISEKLGEECGLDGNLAYVTSAFKNIGILFIAFSYPAIFKKAIETSPDIETALSNLNSLLGFNNKELSSLVAKLCNLPLEIQAAIGNLDAFSKIVSDPKLDKITTSLQRLTKIADDFSNNIIFSKELTKNKIDCVTKVKNIISIDKIDSFIAFINNVLAVHNNLTAEQENEIAESLTELKVIFRTTTININNNRYIKYLPVDVQTKINMIYKKILTGSVSREALEIFAYELVTTAGFQGGCIYLIDYATHQLKPILALGSSKKIDFNEVNVSNLSHIVAKAWRSKIPINGENHIFGKYICAPLGEIKSAGVLLIILKDKENDLSKATLIFKALKKTLEDCIILD